MSESRANKRLAGCSGSVERGLIHLYFGATSLRFQPDVVVQLCGILFSALGQTPLAAIRAAWPMTPGIGQSK